MSFPEYRMTCRRCGFCCIWLGVRIVDPALVAKIDDSGVIPEEAWIHKLPGEKCPHLSFDGTTAVCAHYGRNWWVDNVCTDYHDERPDDPGVCRFGKLMADPQRLADYVTPFATDAACTKDGKALIPYAAADALAAEREG